LKLIQNEINSVCYQIHNVNLSPQNIDYPSYQSKFGWCPMELIKPTFENTTQLARSLHLYGDMRKHCKSRFPAFNVRQCNEPVATDTVFSDTPAIDNGARIAQIFVGRDALVTDIYSMKSNKEFSNTLEYNIRKRGAMDLLISDEVQVEISSKVHDLLQALFIDDWQSEPYHQHQNYAEQQYCTIEG
jgi:hypothetical protein